MIYRRKTYIVEPSFIEEFNQLFNEILLPSQLKYGARLIGRWMIDRDENNTEVFAMWEYDNYEDDERIEGQIKSDKEHVKNGKIEELILKLSEKMVTSDNIALPQRSLCFLGH